MLSPEPVALFIDGDNLPALAVTRTLEHLEAGHAHLPIRRAYGGLKALAGLGDILQRHGVKAEANHGRGTTDLVMAIDVMDLLHAGRLPRLVALASSDADFAPLALRLREAGHRVICFAQRDKSAIDSLQPVYDEVLLIEELPVLAAASRLMQAAQESPRAARPAEPSPVADAETEAVRRILSVLPDWQPGSDKQLNQLGAPLRDAKLAKGSKPLHELFRKHPTFFKVLPASGQAKQVRLLRQP